MPPWDKAFLEPRADFESSFSPTSPSSPCFARSNRERTSPCSAHFHYFFFYSAVDGFFFAGGSPERDGAVWCPFCIYRPSSTFRSRVPILGPPMIRLAPDQTCACGRHETPRCQAQHFTSPCPARPFSSVSLLALFTTFFACGIITPSCASWNYLDPYALLDVSR